MRLALLLAILVSTCPIARADEIVRLTTGDWPPYCAETWSQYGVANQIVTEAFAEVDVIVAYDFFPWPRAMKLARDGEWDGTTIWFYTDDRHNGFFYSDPILFATNSFFYLKESGFDWQGFEDLEHLTVGGTLEYSYGTNFDRAEQAGIFKTHRSRSDEAALENLVKGRIDVLPGSLLVIYETIDEALAPEDAARITHHPKPISSQPLYLLFSRSVVGNDLLVEKFNEGLARLKANGRYNEIVNALLSEYSGRLENSGD